RFPSGSTTAPSRWPHSVSCGRRSRAAGNAASRHTHLLANSIDLSTDEFGPVREAAARSGVVVVCGIQEREGSFSHATLYNTLLTIGGDGAILNRHRKRVPTNPERMV